jgi:uncharacterized membrane protein
MEVHKLGLYAFLRLNGLLVVFAFYRCVSILMSSKERKGNMSNLAIGMRF